MSIVDNLAKRLLKAATVRAKRMIAPNTFHLTLVGEQLKALAYTPGQHLRIFVGLDQQTELSDKVRTYSVWQYDSAEARIELAVCTHSTGIGARWVKSLLPGDTVYFSGPKGKFVVDHSADEYLLIGDSSALAHLYEIRRHLGRDKLVQGIIYSAAKTDCFADLDGSMPFPYYPFAADPVPELRALIRTYRQNSSGRGMVYIGGESRVCVALHGYFRKELGWPVARIRSKPFWHPGKKGLE
jgi:NADPH-dependent ferric siderophore reductase